MSSSIGAGVLDRKWLWATLLCVVVVSKFFWANTLEDAFITFRYSEHLAEGHGYGIFNVGSPPVEGSTTFLWCQLMGLFAFLGLSMESASKFVGFSSLIATILSFWAGSRSTECDSRVARAMGIAAIVTGFYLPLSWYAVCGMETTFAAFCVSQLLVHPLAFPSRRRSWALFGLFGVLLVLTRPEGIAWLCLIVLMHFARGPRDLVRRRALLLVLLSGLGAYLLLTTYRLSIFGDFFPNTYYAKADGSWRHLLLGAKYLLFAGLANGPLILLAALFGLRERKAIKTPLAIGLGLFAAFVVAYCVKVGGDNLSAFPFWRHFLHTSPVWALGFGYLLCADSPKVERSRLLLAVFAALFSTLLGAYLVRSMLLPSIRSGPQRFVSFEHSVANGYIQWLGNIVEPSDSVASALGGELPFVLDAHHIDTLGLSEPWIAHHGTVDPAGAVDSKSDMHWVVEQRPDFIEAYCKGSLLLEGGSWSDLLASRAKMIREMLGHPRFAKDYLFVRNAPYEAMDRALFVHRNHFASMNQRSRLEVEEAAIALARLSGPPPAEVRRALAR